MIEADLPFRRQTAFRLMAVAHDQRLSNVTHVQHLPPHWGTLYELTKLDDATFERKLADGTNGPRGPWRGPMCPVQKTPRQLALRKAPEILTFAHGILHVR